MKHTKALTIPLEQLYPDASKEELAQIEETLDRYIEFIFDLLAKQENRDITHSEDEAHSLTLPISDAHSGISLETLLRREGLKLAHDTLDEHLIDNR